MGVAYNGAHFHGWQAQTRLPHDTVQESLEAALSQVANESIRVHCAGRTDTGVHASAQVIHFDTSAQRSERSWLLGTNANLPLGVSVSWAAPVAEDFHARFSATARRYRYLIHSAPVRPAHLLEGVTWVREPLDEGAMHRAAQSLLGERDFSSFRGAGCQSNTPMRNVHSVEVYRRGELLVIDIQANAFLLHMVRNITGSLLAVGRGDKPEAWIAELMSLRNRTKAAATAKPNGLYLVDVSYPERYQLPAWPVGPYFLPPSAD